MSDVPPPKPWSVDIFQAYRSHLTGFVDSSLVPLIRRDPCRRVLVRAPVKSGKREIAEYSAVRDRVAAGEPKRVHAFVSAWHRVADDEQRDELRQHNLQVFSIIDRTKVNEFIAWVGLQIGLRRDIVIHLDECDHGSGTRQILGRIWREIRDNLAVTTILYSATPEEVLYSDEIDADFTDMIDEMLTVGVSVEYTPIYYNPLVSTTTGFCGPRAFLDAGLVSNATPFFLGTELTPQGRMIIRDLQAQIQRDPTRNIIVLRLSYSKPGNSRRDRKENKAIYEFLRNVEAFPELADFLIIVDKGEQFDLPSRRVLKERIQWSDPNYWRRQATGIPTLIVLDQTSTRSTEWACHHRLFALHAFANKIVFGTRSQADERVNHYANRYGGFQPIRVYAHVKTFQLSAGRITYEDYLKDEWYSRKVDRRRVGDAELYTVKNTLTNELHPSCRDGPISREEADRILQECGCYGDTELSTRVCGTVRTSAVVRSEWYPCNLDTFDEVVASARFRDQIRETPEYRPRNPFVNPHIQDGRIMGNIRGYSVFEYSELENVNWGFNRNNTGPRITVCYRDGVVGIALRTLVGFEERNTLAAFRSMYRVVHE